MPNSNPVATKTKEFIDKQGNTYQVDANANGEAVIYQTNPPNVKKYLLCQDKKKLFLLPKNPNGDKLAFITEDYISHDMNDYAFHSAKEGGMNEAGPDGGQYNFLYVIEDGSNNVHKQMLLFKQDTGYASRWRNVVSVGRKVHKPEKDISEFVSGRIFNSLIGNSAASIFYATRPTTSNENIKIPDETGDNVYVGSIFYDNFTDLYKVIYKLNGLDVPKDRPRMMGSLRHDIFRKGLLKEVKDELVCRFNDFEKITVSSLFLANYDVHPGNYGVISDANHDGTLVKIDHAGALNKLTNHEDIDKYMSPLKGATNHFREFPDEIKFSKPFADELNRIGNFDRVALKKSIDDAIDETAKFYGAESIFIFFKRMFPNKNEFNQFIRVSALDQHLDNKSKKIASTPAAKAALVAATKDYLREKLYARQESMRKHAFEIKLSICIEVGNDGEYKIKDNPPYKMEDLLKEYPDYFAENEFNYRGNKTKTVVKIPIPHIPRTGLGGNIELPIKALTKPALNNLVRVSTKNAVLETLKKALHTDEKKLFDASPDNYSVTFYKHPHERENNIERVVITDRELLKTKYPAIYKKEQRNKPNLEAQWSEEISSLNPGEFAINFIKDTHSSSTQKAYYVERVTQDNKYQVTAHRLPSSIDKGEVFSKILLQHCDHDFQNNLTESQRQSIIKMCRNMRVGDQGITQTSFDKFLVKMQKKNITRQPGLTDEMLRNAFNTAYNNTCFNDPATKDRPCDDYLRFANQQWAAFKSGKKGNGRLCIKPGTDKMLIRSYILICKAFNEDYKDESQYESKHPHEFTLDAIRHTRSLLQSNNLEDLVKHRLAPR